jgi:hypothetical protein
VQKTYHPRAGKDVPAKADAIVLLNVTPLVLHCIKVGHGGSVGKDPGHAQVEFAGQVSRSWCGGGAVIGCKDIGGGKLL